MNRTIMRAKSSDHRALSVALKAIFDALPAGEDGARFQVKPTQVEDGKLTHIVDVLLDSFGRSTVEAFNRVDFPAVVKVSFREIKG